MSTRDALVQELKVLTTTFFSKVSLLETPGLLSRKEQELIPLHEPQTMSELKMCKSCQKSSYCEPHHTLSVATGSILGWVVQAVAWNIFYSWKPEWNKKSLLIKGIYR